MRVAPVPSSDSTLAPAPSRLRLRIPRVLTPGTIEVIHREERAGPFSCTLNVDHPWCGRIIQHVAFFRDAL